MRRVWRNMRVIVLVVNEMENGDSGEDEEIWISEYSRHPLSS